MAIDWQASKEEWIAAVQTQLTPRLLKDARFISSKDCVARFETSVKHWRDGGDIRQLINDGNELAAALVLLSHLKDGELLHYEPRLTGTRKTIDFLVKALDGSRRWVDMKTVAPGWQDDEAAWERFLAIAKDFPENAKLAVDRKFAGAALSGKLLKARWSFIQRTIDLEEKIALLTDQERGPVWLLLCSDGSWNPDDLEDFADFYRTGRFRPDDWSRNAIARYMAERGIAFSHSIAGFCYLERRHDEVEACRIQFDVRGP